MYLSMWFRGPTREICSEHDTLRAASLAANECEASGGMKHFFWKVYPIELRKIRGQK